MKRWKGAALLLLCTVVLLRLLLPVSLPQSRASVMNALPDTAQVSLARPGEFSGETLPAPADTEVQTGTAPETDLAQTATGGMQAGNFRRRCRYFRQRTAPGMVFESGGAAAARLGGGRCAHRRGAAVGEIFAFRCGCGGRDASWIWNLKSPAACRCISAMIWPAPACTGCFIPPSI